jgi:two-component system cell cycle response regulator
MRNDERTATEQTPPTDEHRAGRGPTSAFLVTLAGLRIGEMFRLAKDLTVLGRSDEADFRLLDEGVSRRHAALVRSGDRVLLKDLESANGTYRNGARVWEPVFLEEGDKITMGGITVLKFTYQDDLDERFNRSLYESATRDALTGAYNRRYFDERLTAELTFAIRHGASLALILLDIDHFKTINDGRGHQTGDTTLKEIGRRLWVAVRGEDVLARYGGEEFAILCRDTGEAEAVKLAERLRAAIADELIIDGDTPVRVTASAGVAVKPRAANIDEERLISAADAALYEAKHRGRDRSVVFEEGFPTFAEKGR